MGKLFDWIAKRAPKILLTLLAIVSVSFISYYVWDNYFRPSPSLLDRTIAHMETLIRANPNDPKLRTAVADVYLANGMSKEAIIQYKETLKVIEDHKGALLGLGSAYMALGDDDVAIDYLNRVVELSRDSKMARLDKCLETAYYYLGQIYVGRGQPDQAIEQLGNAIALAPTDADALYLLGRAYQEKGAHNEAIEHYVRAVTLVPDFKEAYQGMTQCYQALGDEAVADYPRGMVALLSGKYQKAIQQLEAAVGIKSDIANAFWGLGAAYERSGQTEAARIAYQQALVVHPDHILAKAGVGRLEKNSP